jgi:hypothetical protein
MRTLMVLDAEALVGPGADVPVPAAARPQRLIRGAVHPAGAGRAAAVERLPRRGGGGGSSRC